MIYMIYMCVATDINPWTKPEVGSVGCWGCFGFGASKSQICLRHTQQHCLKLVIQNACKPSALCVLKVLWSRGFCCHHIPGPPRRSRLPSEFRVCLGAVCTWSPAASLQLLGTPNGAPIGSEASVWAVSSPPRNKIVPHQVGQVVILLSVPKFWLSLPKFIIFHLFHNICNHDIHWHKGTFTTTFCEDVLSANHDLTWSKHQTFQLMFTWFGGVLLMPHDNIMLTPLNSLNTHLQPQGNQTANSILDYIYGSTISTGSIKFHPIMIITIVCIICGKNIYQLCCGCNYILFTKFTTSNTIQIYSNILYIHVMFNKKTPPSPSLESWVPMQAHASHGGCGCACFHRRPGMSLGLGSTPYLQCDYNIAWNSDT